MKKTALVLLHLFARLPLPVGHAIGAGLGWLFSAVPNEHRRVTRINIALCFPELSGVEQRRLVRRSLMETGKALAETAIFWLGPKSRILRLVTQVSGESLVNTAREQGKGVLIIGPHLGAWELVSVYCSMRFPMTSLYRPLRAAYLDETVRAARQRFGARLVPTDVKGVRALLQSLAANGLVGIPPDQDPRSSGGVFAPFFGIQANTMTLLSRLAAKSGAVAILCFAERLPRGRGFHIRFRSVSDEVGHSHPPVAAAAVNCAVEEAARLAPAQYQWSYKRFRTRPKGEPPIY